MSTPLSASSRQVWTCGEAMVALRSDGPLRLGTQWSSHVGGAELNASIGLSRLGHRVTWCSAVGDDPYGTFVVREALAEKVDAHVRVDPDRPTGLMRVIRQAGTSQVSYNRAGSAASTLTGDELVASLDQADPAVALFTGITPALSDGCREGWSQALRRANQGGLRVVLDVNHRPTLWSAQTARAALQPLAGLADVLVGDEGELALVVPDDVAAGGPEAMAGHLLTTGVDLVALKRGVEGATLFTAEGRIDRQADPATELDAIGAGDAFTAGLISGLLDELSLDAVLARAVAMGAWAVSTPGDWEGLPTRAQLDRGRGGVHR